MSGIFATHGTTTHNPFTNTRRFHADAESFRPHATARPGRSHANARSLSIADTLLTLRCVQSSTSTEGTTALRCDGRLGYNTQECPHDANCSPVPCSLFLNMVP